MARNIEGGDPWNCKCSHCEEEKAGNGCETGHQSSGAWPDVTWLAPGMGREMVLCASWHLTSYLTPHSHCLCI